MRSLNILLVLIVVVSASPVYAADETPLVTTGSGTVHKIEKDVITIKHRAADGKFDKDLVLKLTGTSRFSLLSTQKRGEKLVLVQKDIDAKNVAEKQSIAVIYANNGEEHVLLSAVVQAP